MNLEQLQEVYRVYLGTIENAKQSLLESGKYTRKPKKPSKYNPDGSLTEDYMEWEKLYGQPR